MNPNFDPLRKWFDREGIRFWESDPQTLESVHELDVTFRMTVRDLPEDRLMVFRVVAPSRIPESHRQVAAEYAARANARLDWEVLLLNPDDGEFAVRVACDTATARDEERMLGVVRRLMGTVKRHFPALVKLVYGNAPVRDAMATADNPPQRLN